METYRLPYGPNCKGRLPIRPQQRSLYFGKGNFQGCCFLDASLQGHLCKPKGCHMGPMARKAFQKARIDSPIFVQRKFSGLFGFECPLFGPTQDLSNHHPTRQPPHTPGYPTRTDYFSLRGWDRFSVISLTALNRVPSHVKSIQLEKESIEPTA